jgi:HD-GYP domain-containing protein (c-di-GMP phosphodiesterase class II)
MAAAITSRPGFESSAPVVRRGGLTLLALLAPLALLLVLLDVPGLNPELEAPVQHFYIVTAVSLIAFGFAVLVAIASFQGRAYRALFLALGFITMSGLFTVHALSTPGVFGGDEDEYSWHSVVTVSAFLSLAIPSTLVALSYTSWPTRLERRLPFLPVGLTSVAVAALLFAVATLAFADEALIAGLPFAQPPYSTFLAEVSVLLFGFAAWKQVRIYLLARLPLQAGLAAAFLLLAEAQVAMVVTEVWTLAWWLYHLLMLTGVAVALRALAIERLSGRGLRGIVEQALDLPGEVNVASEDVEVIAALSTAIELKDRSMRGHNERVAQLSIAIGREMGLPAAGLRVLARAALLHDVGKLGISDAILLKPGALTASEWEVMKQHPLLGLDVLSRAGSLRREAQIIAAHHERVDGGGYPRGLVGDEIPLEARIIAVADSYDVITSGRPYREARPPAEATRILAEEAGRHYYRPAVEALLAALSRGDLAPTTRREEAAPALR